MSKTIIRWASHTRNYYTWACTKVSPGCMNCYMMALAARQGQDPHGAPQFRATVWKEKIQSGAVYFVNSMSDTYHEGVPVQWIHAIHNDALAHPEAIFLILTKRIERAFYLSPYLAWPKNLWLGTSIENRDYLWRLDYLLKIPAAGHFISAEPLLGSLKGGLETHLSNGLDWVIVGGESGANRRPFNKEWAREIRDMCLRSNIPYMFKQGSAYKSEQDYVLDGQEWSQTPFTTPKPIKTSAMPSFQQLSLF